MIIMKRTRLQRSRDKRTWRVVGIEQPLGVLVKTDQKGYVALKVPSHSYWSGIGMPRSTAPGEWQVYKVLMESPNELVVEGICAVPLKVRQEEVL